MKKTIFAAAAIALIAFASCKKDRTCECTSSSSAGGPTTTETITIIDAKKGDAKRACIKTTQTYDAGGTTVTSTMDCKLK